MKQITIGSTLFGDETKIDESQSTKPSVFDVTNRNQGSTFTDGNLGSALSADGLISRRFNTEIDYLKNQLQT